MLKLDLDNDYNIVVSNMTNGKYVNFLHLITSDKFKRKKMSVDKLKDKYIEDISFFDFNDVNVLLKQETVVELNKLKIFDKIVKILKDKQENEIEFSLRKFNDDYNNLLLGLLKDDNLYIKVLYFKNDITQNQINKVLKTGKLEEIVNLSILNIMLSFNENGIWYEFYTGDTFLFKLENQYNIYKGLKLKEIDIDNNMLYLNTTNLQLNRSLLPVLINKDLVFGKTDNIVNDFVTKESVLRDIFAENNMLKSFNDFLEFSVEDGELPNIEELDSFLIDRYNLEKSKNENLVEIVDENEFKNYKNIKTIKYLLTKLSSDWYKIYKIKTKTKSEFLLVPLIANEKVEKLYLHNILKRL